MKTSKGDWPFNKEGTFVFFASTALTIVVGTGIFLFLRLIVKALIKYLAS